MSERHSRSILEAVAAGDISPSEASELLDAVAAADAPSDQTQRVDQTQPVEPATAESEPTTRLDDGVGDRVGDRVADGVEAPTAAHSRLRISAALHGGPIVIECESGTAVPYADGPASIQVDGNADAGYTVEGELGEDSAIVLPTDIDLQLEANGSDFSLTGINGTLAAELNVGNVAVEGRFIEGDSRIQANAGNVDLRLRSGSDVEVIQRAPVAIRADGLEHSGRGRWRLGDGTARFEIAGNLGTITITAL